MDNQTETNVQTSERVSDSSSTALLEARESAIAKHADEECPDGGDHCWGDPENGYIECAYCGEIENLRGFMLSKDERIWNDEGLL